MGSNRMKDYELTIKVQLSAPAEIDSSSLRESIMAKLAACVSAEVGKFTFYHDQQVLLAEVGAAAEDGSEASTGEPWGPASKIRSTAWLTTTLAKRSRGYNVQRSDCHN